VVFLSKLCYPPKIIHFVPPPIFGLAILVNVRITLFAPVFRVWCFPFVLARKRKNRLHERQVRNHYKSMSLVLKAKMPGRALHHGMTQINQPALKLAPFSSTQSKDLFSWTSSIPSSLCFWGKPKRFHPSRHVEKILLWLDSRCSRHKITVLMLIRCSTFIG